MKPLTAFAALIAVLFLFSPVFAADEPNPEMTVDSVEAASYTQLPIYQLSAEFGVVETFKMDGELLLAVRLGVTPTWTEQIDKIYIEHKDIKVATEGGSEINMLGNFSWTGLFSLGTSSFSEYRPYDWKEKKEKEYYNAVFAIPEGTKSVEFKCGPLSQKIDVPAPSAPPDPTKTVKFAVASAKLLDQVETKHRAGKLEPSPKAKLSNPYGKILEVKLKLTPQMNNGDEPNLFFWKTEWVAVKLADGRFVRTLGQWFSDSVTNQVSNNLNRSSADEPFREDEKTLYFAVPADTQAFTVLYLNQPMAEGRI